MGLARCCTLTTLTLAIMDTAGIDVTGYDFGRIFACICSDISTTVQKVIFEFDPQYELDPSPVFPESWEDLDDVLADYPNLKHVHFRISTFHKETFTAWKQMFESNFPKVAPILEVSLLR